jgi:nicotinamidase-related amidase
MRESLGVTGAAPCREISDTDVGPTPRVGDQPGADNSSMAIKKNPDLHGSAPDKARDALLILDMISSFEFKDGARMFKRALPVANRIARLRDRATAAHVPVIYVNDNEGRWRSDIRGQFEASVRKGSRGAPIATLLRPRAQDYFILKPKHSGFYATPLGTLLEHLGARRLILAGISSHQCVLFTANDAYVRDFELVVPSDCIAAESTTMEKLARQYFRSVLGASLMQSPRVQFR